MKNIKKSNFILASLIIWIFFVFYYFVINQILPYTTRFDDEGYYLKDALSFWNKTQEHGLLYSLKQYINGNYEYLRFESNPNTNLGVFAALFMNVLGPGRMAALSVNLIFYVITLILTLRLVSKIYPNRSELLFIPFIVLFWATFTSMGPGDLFDFRLDFVASCTYGIAVLCFMEILYDSPKTYSKNFLLLLPIFLCVFFRFILIAYLIIPIIYLCIIKFNFGKVNSKKYFYPLFFIFLMCLSVFIWGFRFLKNYYYLQQQSTDEKIFRKQYFSSLNHLDYILYYPKTFLSVYIGYPLLISIIVLTFILILLVLKGDAKFSYPRSNLNILILILLTILSPILILSLNYVRTVQVVGILVIPFIFLLIHLLGQFYIKNSKFTFIFVFTLLILGAVCWPLKIYKNRGVNVGEIKNVELLFDHVYKYSKQLNHGPHQPHIAILDTIEDIDHNLFVVWAAEKMNGDWFFPELVIGRLPFRIELKEILNDLDKSYFFIVPRDWNHLRESKWPILKEIELNRVEIKRWLLKNIDCKGVFVWKKLEYDWCVRKNWFIPVSN